jgi:hypothetical protein
VSRIQEFRGQIKAIKKVSPKTPAEDIRQAQSTQPAGG